MTNARVAHPARESHGEVVCLALGVLPGATLAVLADRGVVPERFAIAIFAVSFIGMNLVHMAATWSRSYLDGQTWRRAKVAHVVVPFALGAFALGFEAVGGAIVLIGLQYYLSIHHGVMSNYGVLRQAQRRAGRSLDGASLRLDQAACLLPTMAALTERARSVSQLYDGAPIWAPPAWLPILLGAAGAAAIVAWLVRETVAARRGEVIDFLQPALVIGVHTVWALLFLGIKNPALPFFALASGHYIQHIYFVRRFEHRPEGLSALPAWIRREFGPERSVRYLLALLAFGGLVVVLLSLLAMALRLGATHLGLRPADALAIPPYAAAMLAVNLHHYWLDGRVWRRPQNRPQASESRGLLPRVVA